jgi:predicted MFS family arabinose efflux permease
MHHRRLKLGYFVLEGVHSFSTVHYFYYFFFFMQSAYGFGNKANLVLAALNGLVYAAGSWQAGKLAQRWGYFSALKLGFGIMAGALAVGLFVDSWLAQSAVMLVTVVGMCFTWPTLEALAAEGETPARVIEMVGIYNVVWATTGAIAYFTGGAILQYLGLKSLFFVPMATLSCQIAFTFWLESEARRTGSVPSAIENSASAPASIAGDIDRPSPARVRQFVRMAWLANPFAYIAINTAIAVMPGVAGKLGLSTMAAGFCCSVWCFARLGAFILLWKWSAWHYRFRWLLAAFAALVSSFAAILLATNLVALVLAQLVFGAAIGLIYIRPYTTPWT